MKVIFRPRQFCTSERAGNISVKDIFHGSRGNGPKARWEATARTSRRGPEDTGLRHLKLVQGRPTWHLAPAQSTDLKSVHRTHFQSEDEQVLEI